MSFTLDHHLYGPTAYRKSRPSSVSSSGFQSQRRRQVSSQPSSADSVDVFVGEMSRRNEKEILQALNDRFAGYIDKVRNLELHNKNLEAEAAALRQSQAGRASIGEHYDRELGDLRGLVQQLTGEKARAALEHEHLEEDIHRVRARLEDEARNREEIEAAARAMNKYVDECGLARLELDKKLRALQEESAFLKKNHEEEVAELLSQIQGAQVSFEVRDTLKADVTSALREIRAQLDGHATKSASQAEEWFKVRMQHLSEAAHGNTEAIRGAQEEIAEYRRQLQSRTIELETLRGTKDSLERQRMETEDRHNGDLNSLQETIHQLDNELKSTKWEMASQLREYQELLNVKMALDIEIAAYRKLLEGEETRFVSGVGPYSYLKLKGEEMSDTVILEEQTDETQVTEVTEVAEEGDTEEGDQEEGEKEEGDKAEGEEAEEEKGEGEEEGDEKKEEEGEGAEEEKGEEEEAGEVEEGKEKSKSPEKAASPPSKSPQSKSPPKSPGVNSPMPKSPAKSPAVKSPADDKSKSPESKSPATKSPESKSPATKSPESKSPATKSPESKSPATKSPESKSPATKSPPTKSPGTKSPELKSPVSKDTLKEEKKEKEQPEPVKEEKKVKEQPQLSKEEKKEKEQPKEKEEAVEKTDKPEAKKESKPEETPKKAETSKPAKPEEDKPAPKSPAKDSSVPPKQDEKDASAKTEDKPPAEEKPAPKVATPEKTESKKDEKKPELKKEEKKQAPKGPDSKESKEEAKPEKVKKSSSTEAKESKEEKTKK